MGFSALEWVRPKADEFRQAAKEKRPEVIWSFIGALGGTRTPNLLIRSQMLYPLSYKREVGLDECLHSVSIDECLPTP